MAEDYLLFLENLEVCLRKQLDFIEPAFSKDYDTLKSNAKFGSYPIGCIKIDNDTKVEIHFLHYKSQEEAVRKWEERKVRINKNKMIVKFSDQNNCTLQHIERFEKLKFANKLFFGSKKYTPATIYIKGPQRTILYLPLMSRLACQESVT